MNFGRIEQTTLTFRCSSVYHLICLANHFRQTGNSNIRQTGNSDFFLPVDGHCPLCDRYTFWGDIIRKKKGCYDDLNEDAEKFEDEN
jgi:hypothetical protein